MNSETESKTNLAPRDVPNGDHHEIPTKQLVTFPERMRNPLSKRKPNHRASWHSSVRTKLILAIWTWEILTSAIWTRVTLILVTAIQREEINLPEKVGWTEIVVRVAVGVAVGVELAKDDRAKHVPVNLVHQWVKHAVAPAKIAAAGRRFAAAE